MLHANRHIVDIGNSSSKINAHCEGERERGKRCSAHPNITKYNPLFQPLRGKWKGGFQKKTLLYKHAIYATCSSRCASSHHSIIPECDVATYRCESIRVGLFKRSMQGCKDTVDADNWPWSLPRSWQNPCHALPTKQSNYIPNWSFLWSHSSFSSLIAVKL